jgi:hypothetical protein
MPQSFNFFPIAVIGITRVLADLLVIPKYTLKSQVGGCRLKLALVVFGRAFDLYELCVANVQVLRVRACSK